MNRATFIYKLRNYLSDLSAYEIERSVNYFNEMIDDRMEEGMTEEEAVADIGDVRLVAEKILTEEGSLFGQIKSQVLPRQKMAGWQKVLLILGAPLWFVLILAGVLLCFVGFLLYLAFWLVAVVITFAGAISIVGSLFKIMEGLPVVILTAAVGFIFLGLGLILVRLAYALSGTVLPFYRKIIRRRRLGGD